MSGLYGLPAAERRAAIAAMRAAEPSTPVAELARRFGVSLWTAHMDLSPGARARKLAKDAASQRAPHPRIHVVARRPKP